MEKIQRIIEENPVDLNEIFSYSPPCDLFNKDISISQRDLVQQCRINQGDELPEWTEVDGVLNNIQKMFYEIPTEVFTF